ncbi:MAG TPA: hypothetical protein VFW94_11670 [Candidatus Acidoferrales bacterium]|nr:hypothetical protein [Candidatus Acidoferrales bacterium]
MNNGWERICGEDCGGGRQQPAPSGERLPEQFQIHVGASQPQHRPTKAFGILNLQPLIEEVTQ